MNREHRLSKDKPYPSVGDVNFPKVVRNAVIDEPESEVTAIPAEQAPTTKPWSLKDFLSTDEATSLYDQMMQQTWTASQADAAAIYYGVSYQYGGGPRAGEIPTIPDFLKVLADRVSVRLDVRAPVNYVQCHKSGPTLPVSPHADPRGMIVPMLVVGQERTFQVGGRVLGKNGKPFPRMASQKSMRNGTHDYEDKYLLRHGSLLIFDGGSTYHSMLPADQDAQANLTNFPWRISILFRWTTEVMREHGAQKYIAKGGPKQYDADIKEFRAALSDGSWQQGSLWEPSAIPQPEPVTEAKAIVKSFQVPYGRKKLTIQIDPEFESLIPPLSAAEFAELKESIREHGLRDPLTVWVQIPVDESGVTTGEIPSVGLLLDGHHRYRIWQELPEDEREDSLPIFYVDDIGAREDTLLWIETNQLGRRNLTDDQRAVVADSIRERRSAIARKERAAKAGETGGKNHPKVSLSVKTADKQTPDPTPAQSPAKQDTREDVAKESGVPVSKMRAVTFLKKNAPEKVKDVRAGKLTLRQATKEAKAAATPKPKPAAQQTPADAVKAITACMDKLVREMSTEDALTVYEQLGEELKQRISVEMLA